MTQDIYIMVSIPDDVDIEKLAGETDDGLQWLGKPGRDTALFKGDKRSIGDVFIRYNGTIDGCINLTFGVDKE